MKKIKVHSAIWTTGQEQYYKKIDAFYAWLVLRL